jgi:hypothetical protein
LGIVAGAAVATGPLGFLFCAAAGYWIGSKSTISKKYEMSDEELMHLVQVRGGTPQDTETKKLISDISERSAPTPK